VLPLKALAERRSVSTASGVRIGTPLPRARSSPPDDACRASARNPSKKEKYSTAMNKAAEFYRYFDKNRIYLPSDVCRQLEEFLRSMRSKVIGFWSLCPDRR
jgi:hypothetical protein